MNPRAGLFFPAVLVFWSLSNDLDAQPRPSGIYASAEDWLNGRPSREFVPSLRKVLHFVEGYDLFRFNDENGYLIGSGDWGLVRNDTLYIWYKGAHFIKAMEQGRICYFKGPPFVTQGQRKAINRNYFWFGMVGGALMSSDIYNQVKDRIHYVLDTHTGRLYPLGVGRMRLILAECPRLLAAFEREAQPPGVSVMLDYVRRLNAGVE